MLPKTTIKSHYFANDSISLIIANILLAKPVPAAEKTNAVKGSLNFSYFSAWIRNDATKSMSLADRQSRLFRFKRKQDPMFC